MTQHVQLLHDITERNYVEGYLIVALMTPQGTWSNWPPTAQCRRGSGFESRQGDIFVFSVYLSLQKAREREKAKPEKSKSCGSSAESNARYKQKREQGRDGIIPSDHILTSEKERLSYVCKKPQNDRPVVSTPRLVAATYSPLSPWCTLIQTVIQCRSLNAQLRPATRQFARICYHNIQLHPYTRCDEIEPKQYHALSSWSEPHLTFGGATQRWYHNTYGPCKPIITAAEQLQAMIDAIVL